MNYRRRKKKITNKIRYYKGLAKICADYTNKYIIATRLTNYYLELAKLKRVRKNELQARKEKAKKAAS